MKLPRIFEMSTTRAEFLRVLPMAVGHDAFVEEGDRFVHRLDGRSWRIGLTPLPELRTGSMRLERHRVDISFAGYSQTEIDAFMARLELHFRRGGG